MSVWSIHCALNWSFIFIGQVSIVGRWILFILDYGVLFKSVCVTADVRVRYCYLVEDRYNWFLLLSIFILLLYLIFILLLRLKVSAATNITLLLALVLCCSSYFSAAVFLLTAAVILHLQQQKRVVVSTLKVSWKLCFIKFNLLRGRGT